MFRGRNRPSFPFWLGSGRSLWGVVHLMKCPHIRQNFQRTTSALWKVMEDRHAAPLRE